VLGSRLDLVAELNAITPLVERMSHPGWQSFLILVNASQRLMDARFAEATSLIEEASRLGGPESEAASFHAIYAWEIAALTGDNLEGVETSVRRAVDDLPYLARGWLCLVLMARGKRDEAATLWKAVAPHVHRLPERAAEWMIANVGNAEVLPTACTPAPAMSTPRRRYGSPTDLGCARSWPSRQACCPQPPDLTRSSRAASARSPLWSRPA
jgi:hypothetical protein